jgi:hypothetical protein
MRLVHAVARVPVSATDPSWAGFAHEERGVSFEGQCLTVTAVSWNGLHSGAIVVRDSAGKIVFSDTTYRDPRNLATPKPGRISFTYNTLWGTGIWETRVAVLCGLTVDMWDTCFEMVVDRTVAMSGYNPDSPPAGWEGFRQKGRVWYEGDTLVLQRSVEWWRFNDDTVPARREQLPTAKIAIP